MIRLNNLLLILISTLILLTTCTNNETRSSRELNPDAVFFDYKIKGEEKDSNVTVYIQFRNGGPDGSTLLLEEPASIQLDGEIIPADSAKLTGVFYEIQKPANAFAGKHSILFTDNNKKEYREEFVYQPFRLTTKIPATVDRGDLAFDFAGLGAGDRIRVILTDTSFESRDIHEIDTVKNGRLVITTDKLKNLVNGPITLQFYKETEKSVTNNAGGSGRIAVSYGLQREFELKTP
jgi:hypothetical protein